MSAPPIADVVIRPATADDALCLSVLAMQVFLDTYATDGIRPALAREVRGAYAETVFVDAVGNPGERLCVAERWGHLIGFSQLTIGRPHPLVPAGAASELLRLYVQQPFTGRRVGAGLLAAAERLAAEAGSQVVWLTAWFRNHRALGFYRSQGYADYGLDWFHIEGESHENRVLAKRIAPEPRREP